MAVTISMLLGQSLTGLMRKVETQLNELGI
jgi:hypothetical protein